MEALSQRKEFIIQTDHKSLAYLNEQNLHLDMQRKAMARLMGLHFKIIYRKGKENVAADALSRVGHMMAVKQFLMFNLPRSKRYSTLTPLTLKHSNYCKGCLLPVQIDKDTISTKVSYGTKARFELGIILLCKQKSLLHATLVLWEAILALQPPIPE